MVRPSDNHQQRKKKKRGGRGGKSDKTTRASNTSAGHVIKKGESENIITRTINGKRDSGREKAKTMRDMTVNYNHS